MDRRRFLRTAGIATAQATLADLALVSDANAATNFQLSIDTASIELARGVNIKTTCYNNQVPGPVLRMREGVPVTVDVHNRTANPELVHWHGLHIGSTPDGAQEEGSPVIAPGAHLRYRFTPTPCGTRWYHTHTMAMADLGRATYTGQFGFLLVDPKDQPGRYDREVFLAVHHWEPTLMQMGEGLEACTQVIYRHACFNDRLLGASDPIRVRAGERVLFHILNASATEDVLLALPGHRFTVLALDGNPVPRPVSVEVLSLAVAERVDVLVEMTHPGVWVLGSLDDQERAIGLGVVIEYANHNTKPQWIAPARNDWCYALFSSPASEELARTTEIAETFTMVFEKSGPQADGIDRWTINGRGYDQREPLQLRRGGRYRLRLVNASGCAHPVHLHRHSFELKRIAQTPVSGLIKDTLRLGRYNFAEVEFIAGNPGLTLFHCHQQLHMDYGFMQLMHYV